MAAARPDLILCGQDMLAMNVYFALADLGLKVGQDVGVASFDNLHPIAKMLQPGLSTMARLSRRSLPCAKRNASISSMSPAHGAFDVFRRR
ncbi:hypothetical protein AOX55_00006641 (plasmid) [Sinorhizobium fredii CCBAU 25509]|nr:hypothetical protein AOX55_00006641 [Sinorhizobium fredii CCBAU 25509]